MIFSCNPVEENSGRHKVINLPESLNHIGMIPLSEIAESIEYIPLETPNDGLVGRIRNIFYENHHIIIQDNTGVITIFDEQGRFVRKIDRMGRGPQEYLQYSSLLLSPLNGNLLMMGQREIKEYDWFGHFIRKVEAPVVDGYSGMNPVIIGKNSYIVPLFNHKYDREYCAAIFDSVANVRQLVTTPDVYGMNQKAADNLSSASSDGEFRFSIVIIPTIFRYGDQTRIFYQETKEILTTDGYTVDTAFVIDYGKYRLPGGLINDSEDVRYLSPGNFVETDHYLFFRVKGTNMLESETSGYFVFNKRNNKTRILYDHEKKENGFKDDLQEGPAFWPRSVNSDQMLVSFIDSDVILDYVKDAKGSDVLKSTLSGLKEDSNPIVVLVKQRR